ncbi:hypothetical protein J4466_01520 [Candidatus Pacearchaeota archaeon]|nr:hypothetical protein [Candidatus Pacearchaeota archaeon]
MVEAVYYCRHHRKTLRADYGSVEDIKICCRHYPGKENASEDSNNECRLMGGKCGGIEYIASNLVKKPLPAMKRAGKRSIGRK